MTEAAASDGLFKTFAGCVGRMSAEMEHAWLLNTESADKLKAQRMTFISLLDAVTPAGREREALIVRVDTKMAHASLLTTASFGTTPTRSRHAQRRAERLVSQCRALLLDS